MAHPRTVPLRTPPLVYTERDLLQLRGEEKLSLMAGEVGEDGADSFGATGDSFNLADLHSDTGEVGEDGDDGDDSFDLEDLHSDTSSWASSVGSHYSVEFMEVDEDVDGYG